MKVTCPMCHGTGQWLRGGELTYKVTGQGMTTCQGCGGNGWQEDKQSTGWPAWPVENRRIDSLERRVTDLEQRRKKKP